MGLTEKEEFSALYLQTLPELVVEFRVSVNQLDLLLFPFEESKSMLHHASDTLVGRLPRDQTALWLSREKQSPVLHIIFFVQELFTSGYCGKKARSTKPGLLRKPQNNHVGVIRVKSSITLMAGHSRGNL
jgi:hypothetical protein